MDSSFYLFVGAIVMVIGLLFAALAWTFFRRFKRLSTALNRAHEMTQTADGSISEIVTVTRRNRSFRWRNEYPVIAYTANDKRYTVHLNYVEKRAGHYQTGGHYRVCYVPHDPGCCVVDEFRKQMQKARTQYLIWTVVFAFFTFNMIFSGLSTLLSAAV